MSIPNNVTGLYCPGCAPGDFPQPHICGISNQTISGWCGLCNTYWTGSHACLKSLPAATTTTTGLPTTITDPPRAGCDHCFCLKQKAGWHDVPSPTPSWPGRTQSHHLKPHQVCCNCGNRRVKDDAK